MAQPGEREGFISLPHSFWFRKGLPAKAFSRFEPSKHPLAVELETENDADGENFQLIRRYLHSGRSGGDSKNIRI
jgi:hypothetical protein